MRSAEIGSNNLNIFREDKAECRESNSAFMKIDEICPASVVMKKSYDYYKMNCYIFICQGALKFINEVDGEFRKEEKSNGNMHCELSMCAAGQMRLLIVHLVTFESSSSSLCLVT